MKRRARVLCAAADSDDEDLGTLFSASSSSSKRPAQSREEGTKPAEAVGAALPASKKQVKEKEFAWMDSDSDQELKDDMPETKAGDGPHDKPKAKNCFGERSGAAGQEKSENGKEAASEDEHGHSDSDENVEVTEATLDAVQNFGRMILLAPALRKQLRVLLAKGRDREKTDEELSPQAVAAACRAMARTKFFDADLLDDLNRVLMRLIRDNKLDAAQATDVICSLRILNAYDAAVFAAIAAAFRGRTSSIEAGHRADWCEIFRSFGHERDQGFLQLLEAPPLPVGNPSYRKVRCRHHHRGSCVIGAGCTFSHDQRAPWDFIAGTGNEDWWRSKPLVMTQNQRSLGHGVYGGMFGGGGGFTISQ